jgi:hypothetical protein
MLVRFGDITEIINVLSLPLSPKSVFKIVKRDRGIIVDSNKPTISKNGPQGLSGGTIGIPGVGNTDVKFSDVQGLGGRLRSSWSLAL